MSNPDGISPISIRINGEPREVPPGLTVRSLLEHLQVDPARVAVELNRKLARKPEWDRAQVEAGAEVEIVEFVGGG